ncbi:hypothetical protein GCM10022294_20970 [Dietzia aurantiaca]
MFSPSACEEPPNCSAVEPVAGGAAGIGGAAATVGAIATIDTVRADTAAAAAPDASRRADRDEGDVNIATLLHECRLDGWGNSVHLGAKAKAPVHHWEPGPTAEEGCEGPRAAVPRVS